MIERIRHYLHGMTSLWTAPRAGKYTHIPRSWRQPRICFCIRHGWRLQLGHSFGGTVVGWVGWVIRKRDPSFETEFPTFCPFLFISLPYLSLNPHHRGHLGTNPRNSLSQRELTLPSSSSSPTIHRPPLIYSVLYFSSA